MSPSFVSLALKTSLLVAVFMSVSCLKILEKGDEAPTGEIVFDEATMADTITVGDTLKVAGNITVSGELGLNYRLLDSEGESAIGPKLFIFLDTTVTDRSTDWDLAVDEKLIVVTKNSLSSVTCGGDYTLEVDVGVDGGIVTTGTFPFHIRGPECGSDGALVADVTLKSDSLGAQSAVAGSAIDLDAFTSYTRNNATDNSSAMDLYFGYLTSSGEPELFTPARASEFSTLFPSSAMDNWGTANATQFYKTSIGSDFSSIKTQYQIDALWNSSETFSKKIGVNSGDVFIAKTAQGKVVIFKITSSSGTGASTVIQVSGYN